jgi:hypothetical protein
MVRNLPYKVPKFEDFSLDSSHIQMNLARNDRYQNYIYKSELQMEESFILSSGILHLLYEPHPLYHRIPRRIHDSLCRDHGYPQLYPYHWEQRNSDLYHPRYHTPCSQLWILSWMSLCSQAYRASDQETYILESLHCLSLLYLSRFSTRESSSPVRSLMVSWVFYTSIFDYISTFYISSIPRKSDDTTPL